MSFNVKSVTELTATGFEVLSIFIVSIVPVAAFLKFVLSAVTLINEAVKIVRKHTKSGALNNE